MSKDNNNPVDEESSPAELLRQSTV